MTEADARLKSDPQTFASLDHDLDHEMHLMPRLRRRHQSHHRARQPHSSALTIASLVSEQDAALIANADGSVAFFNNAYALLHRFNSRQDCQQSMSDGLSLFEFQSSGGQTLPCGQSPLSLSLQGETCFDRSLGVRRLDTGHTWTAVYSFAPICKADGTIVGSVVTARPQTMAGNRPEDSRG
jgi:hypothetical protein